MFVVMRVLWMAGFCAGYTRDLLRRDGLTSPTDVCTRWSHQSALVNDTLYIYGGQAKTSPLQHTNTWNNNFLKLDLTKDFDIDSPPLQGLPKLNGPPAVANGYLWHNNENLFLYGGLYSDSPPKDPDPFALWAYSFDNSSWYEPPTSLSSGTPPVQRAAEGAGVTVPDRNIGYYFGGHLDGYTTDGWSQSTPRVYLKSLVSYDMSKSQWTNVSVDTSTASFPERADGVLAFVPYGKEGILLGLAGGTNQTFTQLNIVDVFDIATSKWTKQSTSGPTPEIRVNPCAVLFSAPDGSSHNIYMYGGQNLIPYGNQTQYSDMWILTIPSFTWMQVGTKNQAVPPARAGHSCDAYNGQIVVVGGYVGEDISCDSPGVYVFDASKLSWENKFHGGASKSAGTYAVPELVVQQIGGDSAGGATVNVPQVSPDPDSPFATPITPSTYPYATFLPHSSASASAGGQSTGVQTSSGGSGGGTNVGAIVGGIIGGIAVLVGLAFLGMYLFYRRRVKQLRKSLEEYHERQEQQAMVEARNSNATWHSGPPTPALYPPTHDAGMVSKDDLLDGHEPTFWGMLLSPKRSLRITNM